MTTDPSTRSLWVAFGGFLLISGLFLWGTIYKRLNTFTAGERPFFAENQAPPSLPPVRSSDPRLGSDRPDAIEMVEYADYRCSHCRLMAPDLFSLLSDTRKNVRLIWREAPTQDQSREGLLPFIAARCAHRQGKFAALHPALFATPSYTDASVLALAGAQSLDTKRFQACMNDPSVMELIRQDQAQALLFNINAAPTFFVRGQPFIGALSRAQLEGMLQ